MEADARAEASKKSEELAAMSLMSAAQRMKLKKEKEEAQLKDEQAAKRLAAEAAKANIMKMLDPKDPASVKSFETAMANN
jgi:hypothetical protein